MKHEKEEHALSYRLAAMPRAVAGLRVTLVSFNRLQTVKRLGDFCKSF